MVEKKQPEAEEDKTTQPEGEVKPQPTVEELQGKISEIKAEVDRKEEVIQQTKRELRETLRRGGSKAEVEALSKKIDDVQDWIAGAMDDLTSRVSGEYEESKPQRKSYKEQLDASRANKPKQEIDPAAQRFFDYLTEEGLDFNDDNVQETIKDTKTPQEALKAVKEMVKNMNQGDVKKLAEEMVKEQLPLAVEQALKDRGLTTPGAGAPSGSSGGTFTRKQIKEMSLEEYKERKPEIDEAIRQGKVKD